MRVCADDAAQPTTCALCGAVCCAHGSHPLLLACVQLSTPTHTPAGRVCMYVCVWCVSLPTDPYVCVSLSLPKKTHTPSCPP